MENLRGYFFMIIGPSGAGKETLIKQVLEDFKELNRAISHTTRKKENMKKTMFIITLYQEKNIIKCLIMKIY